MPGSRGLVVGMSLLFIMLLNYLLFQIDVLGDEKTFVKSIRNEKRPGENCSEAMPRL